MIGVNVIFIICTKLIFKTKLIKLFGWIEDINPSKYLGEMLLNNTDFNFSPVEFVRISVCSYSIPIYKQNTGTV